MTISNKNAHKEKLNLAKVDSYSEGDHTPEEIIRFLRQTEKAHFGEYLSKPSKEASAFLDVWQSEEVGQDEPFDWRGEYTRQSEIPTLNDAEILGKDHPALVEFYNQPMVFMTGNLYGQGDRRNTRDGDWKRTEMTLLQWIEGGDGWGLSRHPEAKSKVGSSIVPSENIDC